MSSFCVPRDDNRCLTLYLSSSFRVYFLLIVKMFAVEQGAMFCGEQPHVSCVYLVS